MIKTEEDAENAFQLSSALTQALLDYRMKSFGTVSFFYIQWSHLKFCIIVTRDFHYDHSCLVAQYSQTTYRRWCYFIPRDI